MHAYISGPMFNPGEQYYLAQIDERVRKAGFTTFLPTRDGLPFVGPQSVEPIFRQDVQQATKADVVVACLNGMDVDSGTACELGMAYASGRYIVGVYTDLRLHFQYQTVNLMIQCSLDHLSTDLDDLEWHLAEYLKRKTTGPAIKKK
jgi:nucleoside 2-deoxyribosyltransferase